MSGYGYWPPPYSTAYRRALRTTRTRLRTRIWSKPDRACPIMIPRALYTLNPTPLTINPTI